MGLTYGTTSRNGVPLYLKFIFGGTEMTSWKQPIRINQFSNSGESVDGKYRISDLDVTFPDVYGSMFATTFGNGTRGFGSSLQVVAYLGGTMEYQSQAALTVWKHLGTAGAVAATLHTGKVYGLTYSGRTLRIRSRTALGLTSELQWQFPVHDTSMPLTGGAATTLGTWFYYPYDLTTTYLGTTAFYDYDSDKRFKVNAYVTGSNYGDYGVHTEYPAMSGRGTVPIDPNFYWPGTNAGGTNFYDVYGFVNFDGTYLGTKYGTINTDYEAQEYGYTNLSAAESAKSGGTSIATYVINKTRLRPKGTYTGSALHWICPMTIGGSPAEVFELLMTGAMVSPFFTTADLDVNTFATSSQISAFSYFEKIIDFDDKSVLASIKDVVDSTQALFSVNPSNKFEFMTYGPRNLTVTIPSMGTADIIETTFENLEEDYFNRFLIKYQYDSISGRYNAQTEIKTQLWTRTSDRLKTMNCQWIQNPNEAVTLCQRLADRYKNTLPHVNIRTNLNKIGYGIGTLLTITDVNSMLSSKVIQLTGFKADWEEKTIDFEALDAEALYLRKGYAFWMAGTALPGNAVSGTSTSGWGTGGTQANINATLYGTFFSWW